VYGESKALGELLVTKVYRSAGNRGFTIVRPGMVYGPNSPYWTARYLRMAQEGQIRVLGRGGRVFPVHEDDLVATVIKAASRPGGPGRERP
jgi:nucleoside-diphosphate-sugar epimerase